MSNPTGTQTPAIGSLARLAVLGALVTGCTVSTPLSTPGERELVSPTFLTGKAPLINEGGPVFALPGTVRMPAYSTGEPAALTVRAERLDGGTFPRVDAAAVAADGAFELKGPITSKLFFATAEFTQDNHLNRLRTVARAEPGDPLVLDVASSLMSAKIAMAAQKRLLDDLDYTQAKELTAQVRSTIGADMAGIRLDQPNEVLSEQLDTAVRPYQVLATRLGQWEASINPRATPRPAPTPSPTPTPAPTATPEPVK